ncbi:MAG: DNA polymerase III subunit beta [Actinobacteria bacterium]|nr:DNA polymerase III subunit beta [Actinomycetota bacterium]
MRFRCGQENLLSTIVSATRATAGRAATSAILGGLHLELIGDRLEIAGTDLDLTIQASLAAAGSRDGSAVVPARLLLEVVRVLPEGQVSVSLEGEDLEIQAGRSSYSIRTLTTGDFPVLRSQIPLEHKVSGSELRKAFRQVIPAASKDDSRPLLTGVLILSTPELVRAVATDSYRLAVKDLSAMELSLPFEKVLIPARALVELERLLAAGDSSGGDEPDLDPAILVTETEAVFQVGSVRLTTRLLDGSYPDFEQLVPKSYPNRLVVDKKMILDALRRIKPMVKEHTISVRIAMLSDSAILSVIAQDMGTVTEEIDADYEGDELTIAFNPTYLTEGIEAVEGDRVIIETIDTSKPATVRAPEDPTFRYLLMPVRVS